jgi:hypothetical protein
MVFLTYLQAKRAEQVLFVASFVDHQIKSNHANAIQMGKIMIIPFFFGCPTFIYFHGFSVTYQTIKCGFPEMGLHQKWMVHSGKSESEMDNLN